MAFKKIVISILFTITTTILVQSKQDSLAIKQVEIDYIEYQHKINQQQMERALHPRMVKRTFWKDKATGKDYIRETSTESMILLAESYNKKGDAFP
jgi:hypothetical protein